MRSTPPRTPRLTLRYGATLRYGGWRHQSNYTLAGDDSIGVMAKIIR